MQIAIVGTGSIGSTFAWHLARAGHDVTVVARGARLARLERDRAIVRVDGARAEVRVSRALDTATAFDLVLVTVFASQVDALLPTLAASAARTVMFAFNTFEPLDRLREAVGAGRFAFGFPAIIASLDAEGRLASQVITVGQITTVTERAWAEVFGAAGIGSVVHDDMHAWLRTHAAFVAPLMALGCSVHARGAGVSLPEALCVARAMREGFALVRALGQRVTPAAMTMLAWIPAPCVALGLWGMSRTRAVRALGANGPGEARALIDAMVTAAPERTAALSAIRP